MHISFLCMSVTNIRWSRSRHEGFSCSLLIFAQLLERETPEMDPKHTHTAGEILRNFFACSKKVFLTTTVRNWTLGPTCAEKEKVQRPRRIKTKVTSDIILHILIFLPLICTKSRYMITSTWDLWCKPWICNEHGICSVEVFTYHKCFIFIHKGMGSGCSLPPRSCKTPSISE